MLLVVLSTTVVILLASPEVVRSDFTPGCSFVGGQCQYSVTLGHAGQCDSSVAGTSSQISTGGAQCCDDVKADFNNLRSDVDTLQSQVSDLVNDLSQSKDDLAQTQTTLDQTEAARDALVVTLRQKEAELSQTQTDLSDLLQQTGNEITALREELDNVTSQSDTCRAALGLPTTNTKLSTSRGAGVDLRFCDFSSITEPPCQWTVLTPTMVHLMDGSRSSYHGPTDDHTRGSGSSTYLGLDSQQTSVFAYSSKRLTYSAVSELYEPADSYCFFFYYNMVGIDVLDLKTYIKLDSGSGYPVFERSGKQNQGWHLAQFELDSEYSSEPFSVVFEFATGAYKYQSNLKEDKSDIGVDDLYAYNTSCDQIPKCPRHSFHRNTVDTTTSCYTFHVEALTWTEAFHACRKEGPWSSLVSVESQEEQEYLAGVIKADPALSLAGRDGFYTSGNDINIEEEFKWTDTGSGRSVDSRYENWHTNQPNNVGGVQDCLLLEYSSENYTWGDVDCNKAYPYICEVYFTD